MSKRRTFIAGVIGAAAVIGASVPAAEASSGPIGPLPQGPSTTVATPAGELVAIALPHRTSGGWRLARGFNSPVARQVSEADVGSNVVIVFKTLRAGSVTIAFALTRGETSKALESRTYNVKVL